MVKQENRRPEEQKLAVLTESLKLVTHTAQITSNQNIFTLDYAWLTAALRDEALRIFRNLSQANELDLFEEYDERRGLQRNAIATCKNLKSDIVVAQKVFHLRSKKVIYWTSLVNSVIPLIRKWMDSDAKRYNSK